MANEIRKKTQRPEHTYLPGMLQPETACECVIGLDYPAGKDAEMPDSALESWPAGRFYLKETRAPRSSRVIGSNSSAAGAIGGSQAALVVDSEEWIRLLRA